MSPHFVLNFRLGQLTFDIHKFFENTLLASFFSGKGKTIVDGKNMAASKMLEILKYGRVELMDDLI